MNYYVITVYSPLSEKREIVSLPASYKKPSSFPTRSNSDVLDFYQVTIQLIGRRLLDLQSQLRYDSEVSAEDKKQISDAITTIIASLSDVRTMIRSRL